MLNKFLAVLVLGGLQIIGQPASGQTGSPNIVIIVADDLGWRDVGYHGGEVNPMGGHLIVRQSDAHAWTEVWLDGQGWRRVDPTAAVAP